MDEHRIHKSSQRARCCARSKHSPPLVLLSQSRYNSPNISKAQKNISQELPLVSVEQKFKPSSTILILILVTQVPTPGTSCASFSQSSKMALSRFLFKTIKESCKGFYYSLLSCPYRSFSSQLWWWKSFCHSVKSASRLPRNAGEKAQIQWDVNCVTVFAPVWTSRFLSELRGLIQVQSANVPKLRTLGLTSRR